VVVNEFVMLCEERDWKCGARSL